MSPLGAQAPVTRRQALVLFAIILVYVTAVFFVAQTRPSRDEVGRSVAAKIARAQYHNDLNACRRANAVRRESNLRIPDHQNDADDLARLSRALSRHRRAEAAAFVAIGRAFHIERNVAPLVRVLRRAALVDRQIQARQRGIHFRNLRIIDCRFAVRRPPLAP